MLVIRMQRTGRKGYAQFRVVVQDSRRTPTSGKIVASIGHFNPHTKETTLNKERASFYLEHGAQPSDRVARLLKSEGVKLPKWVKLEGKQSGTIRNPEKLRKNRPAGEPASPKAEAEETPATDEAPAEETTEALPETPPEEPAAEAPAQSEEPATDTTAEAVKETAEPEPVSEEANPETPETK